MRRLALAALIALGSLAIVGMADVALAPELRSDLWRLGTAVADHLLVKAVVFVLGVTFVLALCAAAWERSEREYERRIAEAETQPAALRAPCGEVIRPGYGKGLLWTPTPGRDETKALFPGSPATHDSGHRASGGAA